MISIKHVLVPTDFSEAAAAALKYGKAFAENFGARLHVIHVLHDDIVMWPVSEGADMVAPIALDELQTRTREELEGLLSPTERAAFSAKVTLLRGLGSPEIIEYAQREQIDLIVMGTHGRGPLAHVLMGGVADKVLRKAPCPVLIVREKEHEFIVP